MGDWVRMELDNIEREFNGNSIANYKEINCALDYGSFSFTIPNVKPQDDQDDEEFIAEVTESGYRVVDGPIAMNPNKWYATFHVLMLNMPEVGPGYSQSFFAQVNKRLGALNQ
ncbi:hypothetical protein J8273_3488 [Carpediemonas membranifera]|uniref:Uncharacterized protein n=1 Tax=Carpediemonas membranifera TaxID=201153 RepID=A0A8J6E1E0_9EUKA|nr:hypothetical protein J8273_3488 [Carpediemonas membranifera]|eukprot:KAG9393353.1 hypothetical protein J8273_3488 [Carpediemonas membranifera]